MVSLCVMLPCGEAIAQVAVSQGVDGRPANTEAKAAAQAEPETTAAPQSEVPAVPGISSALHGWNAGLTISGVHNSTTGWSTLANPAVGYSFNDVFSLDVTIPIYFYRLAESLAIRPKENAELVNQRGEPGDTVLSVHAQFVPKGFTYEITGAGSFPSGDEAYGLTTGRVTFDLDNHFERAWGRFTPTVSIGGGDSSTLVNRLVTRNYTSLGPLAHFQTGVALELLRGVSFEADAYEQLPIGDQKVYGPSRNGRATIVVGHHVSEDNGFTTSMDVALDRHTTLSGYYNRSLRFHDDTVGFGLTYVLRSPPPADDNAMDDLFR